MDYLEAREDKKSLEQVFKDISSEITDMGIVIDSWAAGIKLDLSRRQRQEGFYLAAQGVEEFDHGQESILLRILWRVN